MDLARCFSEDYGTARERFRNAARSSGAKLYELPIDANSPSGTPLSIDIALIGSREPRRAIVHTSGLHGVEGFAGSAIQLSILNQKVKLSPDGALVLVHALNPYGMAWLRRFNENNVDLNRNFVTRDSDRSRTSDGYRRLEPFLNPRSQPKRDFFYARAAYYILKYGLQPLRQAIAEGQYEFPNGIFFGGDSLEQGPATYLSWLKAHLASLKYGFVIDVHTGLGKSGQETLFLRSKRSDPTSLGQSLDRQLTVEHTGDEVGYYSRGHHAEGFEMLGPELEYDFLTQEFGTYSSVQVLHALREENRWHQWGRGTVDHPAKIRLKESFAPESVQWRETIVNRGLSLFEAVRGYVFPQAPRQSVA